MARASEDDLIARYFAPIATAPGAAGLTDDAAVLPRVEGDLVVTKDMGVANVHFFSADPPGAIAQKMLRVNLSDLAAKGARPVGFLLGLALPPDWSEAFVQSFARGLAGDAALFNCPLYGGDTVKIPGPLTVSITAFGEAPSGRTVRRAGARAGDVIAVTGTIGDAALGLALRGADHGRQTEPFWAARLQAETRAFLIDRYLIPQPRLGLASALSAQASAAMDISDGLIGDLAKLLAVSGVSGRVQAAKVPLSTAAIAARDAAGDSLLETMLTGGDDYEIVFTCPPAALQTIFAAAASADVDVTPIGAVGPGQGLTVVDAQGDAIAFDIGRYQHF